MKKAYICIFFIVSMFTVFSTQAMMEIRSSVEIITQVNAFDLSEIVKRCQRDYKYDDTTMLLLEKLLGRKVGPSTGTNMVGVLQLAKEMTEKGETGSIVTLLCDRGDRYLDSYYSPEWVKLHITEAS